MSEHYFRRWVADDKSNTSNTLTLGPVIFVLSYSDKNFHGREKKDEKGNWETITGPRFAHIKLKRESAGLSHRFIFYVRSGAWYHFDVYVTLSRKYKTVGAWVRSWSRRH